MDWAQLSKLSAAFIAGNALVLGYWQFDEWATLQHTGQVYVTAPEARLTILSMEAKRNGEHLLWLCLEHKDVDVCKVEYYQRERVAINQESLK